MQRRMWTMMVALALAAGMGWSAEPTVAVVNMGELIKAHPDTAGADSLLEKQADEFETEQKDMEAEYEKLKRTFEDARKETMDKALSDAAREEKIKVAEEKLMAIRDQEKRIRETLNSRQKQIAEQRMRMQKRIVAKIQEVIREHAAKKGLALVLDSGGMSVNGVEVVLYAGDKVDVTEDIRQILLKTKPSEAAKPEAKDDAKAEPKAAAPKAVAPKAVAPKAK